MSDPGGQDGPITVPNDLDELSHATSSETLAPGYGVPPQGPPPAPGGPRRRNTLGIIALIVAVIGFVLAGLPVLSLVSVVVTGFVLIIGWILLGVAFVLGLISLFLKGRRKGMGIAAMIVSVLGGILSVVLLVALFVFVGMPDIPNQDTPPQVDSGNGAPTDSDDDDDRADPEDLEADAVAAIGETVETGDWRIRIDAYQPDGDTTVAGAFGANADAVPGSHYEIVTYALEYIGDDRGLVLFVTVELLTASGEVIDSPSGLVRLRDHMEIDPLDPGQTRTGSLPYQVPDGENVMIRVEVSGPSDDEFVFLVEP